MQEQFTARELYEIDVIAETLWGEARGEGWRGIKAVASVIANRSKGGSFAATCLAPMQFSHWNGRRRPTLAASTRGFVRKQFRTEMERMVWSYCVETAKMMVRGSFVRTTAATHYCRIDCHPKWRSSLRNREIIGRHVFGNV